MSMYAAPPIVSTQVFAAVPQEFQIKGRSNEWLEARQHGTLTSFLEGPSFDTEGNLYCTDIPYGRIFKVSPKGSFELVTEYDGEPNGLKINKEGRIFIADQKRGLLTLDPGDSKPRPYIERLNMERLKGPNDLVFSRNGDLYFTDQAQTGLQDPTGRVWRVCADGRVDLLLDNVPSPNGIVLNLNETILYVAVTRANAVWRVPLNSKNGLINKVGLFIQLSGGGGPDGLALDEQGNLAIAHAGLGAVWLFSPIGEPLCRINSCTGGRMITNLAYGGPENKTLYMTESSSGSILVADMQAAGKKMYSHM